MPFIAPTPQTAKLWGRLNRVPLLLDMASIFLGQFILVACIANGLQAIYHQPNYHGDSDSLYLPPPSLGNASGHHELEEGIILDHFPNVIFLAPILALITATTKMILYGGRTLRPVAAIFVSVFMLLSWLLHVDVWYDIGTMVKWKSESALPIILAFVFPWQTMMMLGSAASMLDLIYLFTAIFAATTGHKQASSQDSIVRQDHEDDSPPPYPYSDEQTLGLSTQESLARARTRRWMAWTPNNVLLSTNQTGYGTIEEGISSTPRSRSQSPNRPAVPSSRTESLTDVITILSGSIISNGSDDNEQMSRSLP